MQLCFIDTFNLLEEIGIQSILADLNWVLASPESISTPQDAIGILGFDPQKPAQSAANLAKYRKFQIVLLCSPQDLNTQKTVPEYVAAVIFRAFTREEVTSALKIVQAGHSFTPKMVRKAGGATLSTEPSAQLTKRELEVASAVAQGDTNKEIARRLGISANTVDVHVASIRKKFVVQNRTQIAKRLFDTKNG